MSLADGLYGALIGAAITAAVALAIYYLQKKDATKTAAEAGRDAKKTAAKRQRNDIARNAHLLIANFQDKVLRVSASSVSHNGNSDAINQDVAELLTTFGDQTSITAQLQMCCPTQDEQLRKLMEAAVNKIPSVDGNDFTVFSVCDELSKGLSSIRGGLIAMLREE